MLILGLGQISVHLGNTTGEIRAIKCQGQTARMNTAFGVRVESEIG